MKRTLTALLLFFLCAGSLTPAFASENKLVPPQNTTIASIKASERRIQGDPLVASGLSLALSGAGQWYNGDREKALWLLAPTLAYPVALLFDSLLDSSLCRVGTFTVMLAAKGYSVWDAYHTAEPKKNR